MFAAEWNLRTSYVTSPVYRRLRVNTFRELSTAKNRRITSGCIKSCHGLCQDQIVVDSPPLTSKLSLTNAEPSFLEQSSLPSRASQNAFQQLSSARLQNDFKIPFRQLVKCIASSKFRVRHQIPCDIFGWPYFTYKILHKFSIQTS
jgi:hypothetical protein